MTHLDGFVHVRSESDHLAANVHLDLSVDRGLENASEKLDDSLPDAQTGIENAGDQMRVSIPLRQRAFVQRISR